MTINKGLIKYININPYNEIECSHLKNEMYMQSWYTPGVINAEVKIVKYFHASW